jgi:hypothetical protein
VTQYLLRDETWGWVLIGLGIVMLVWRPFNRLDDVLRGKPDQVLTAILMAVGLVYIGIGLFAPRPSLKALAVFWAVTP